MKVFRFSQDAYRDSKFAHQILRDPLAIFCGSSGDGSATSCGSSDGGSDGGGGSGGGFQNLKMRIW